MCDRIPLSDEDVDLTDDILDDIEDDLTELDFDEWEQPEYDRDDDLDGLYDDLPELDEVDDDEL